MKAQLEAMAEIIQAKMEQAEMEQQAEAEDKRYRLIMSAIGMMRAIIRHL